MNVLVKAGIKPEGPTPQPETGPQPAIPRPAHRSALPPRTRPLTSASAFTLIELILVMAILTMAVSVTAPTLANFFRGRTLDAEARRLLAMTRGGQNRAVRGVNAHRYHIELPPNIQRQILEALFEAIQDLRA